MRSSNQAIRISLIIIVSIPLLLFTCAFFAMLSNVFQDLYPSAINRKLAQVCHSFDLGPTDIWQAKDLLDLGANPDQSYGGLEVPLLKSVLANADNKSDRFYYNELIELLLQHGADPNQQRSGEGSFLYLAVGHPDTEQILLKYGARVSTSTYTFSGKTILETAKDDYDAHKPGSSLKEVELLQRALDEEKKTLTSSKSLWGKICTLWQNH